MDIFAELEKLRRHHTYCEDCWYSCPKATGGCCNDAEGDDCTCGAEKHNSRLDNIINYLKEPCDAGKVSDGHHTFDELYSHRMHLFVALMNAQRDISWKSRKHADGSMFNGDWFVAGMELPTGMITYHLKGEYWYLAEVKELDFAPEWDGHTSKDVIDRLEAWLNGPQTC